MMVLLYVFPFAMILAATSDLLSMTIPNRLSAGLFLAFFALAPFAGMDAGEIGWHFAASIAVLAFGIGCFSAGWMGGGDAKLMTAVALWLGPTELLLQFAVVAALFGGALTILLLQARIYMVPATGIGFVDRLLHPETGVPYGIALGLAGLAIYPSTPLFQVAMRSLAGI